MARITWYGHAAFLVEVSQKKILIDPWISNPLSPVSVDKVPNPDYIVLTHDHGDHVGDAVKILRRSGNTKLVAIYELADHVASEAGARERAIGANIGGPIALEGITIYLTPAMHSSSKGSPTGVVIQSSEGSIYHAGDTGVFSDMALIRELYSPRIAMLPIGGHFTMGVREAAKAVELLGIEIVIPMHYNTFPLIKADPNELADLIRRKGLKTEIKIMRPGETITI
ncbi:MAG: metal-dependent hydrolase [Desulfurococcales archaeon]|jgi:L-ascorbate metabolism protein UlaG (beta-lactamase superfamily)|nr:metal-dependent hydrolase [Desulfurococcales archaeon]